MKNIRNTACKITVSIILSVILIMPCGRVFGRYYTVNDNEVSFTIQRNNKINIFDEYMSSVDEMQMTWNTAIREKIFYLATYDKTHNITLTDSQMASIEIFIPDMSSNMGNLTIRMQIKEDTTKTYTAKAEYISSKTLLYKEKGSGWIYRFYDTNGEEIQIQMHGNQLYDSKVIVTLINQDIDIKGTIGVKCNWV